MSIPESTLYVAKSGALLQLDGVRVQVVADVTVVREGHPLLARLPDGFRVVRPSVWRCWKCQATSELPWCPTHPPPAGARRLRRKRKAR